MIRLFRKDFSHQRALCEALLLARLPLERLETFADNCFAIFSLTSPRRILISSSLIPRTNPSSSTPISYKHSPPPSFNRHNSCVVSFSKFLADGFTRCRLYSTEPSSDSGLSRKSSYEDSKSNGDVGDALFSLSFSLLLLLLLLDSFSFSSFLVVEKLQRSLQLLFEHLHI